MTITVVRPELVEGRSADHQSYVVSPLDSQQRTYLPDVFDYVSGMV